MLSPLSRRLLLSTTLLAVGAATVVAAVAAPEASVPPLAPAVAAVALPAAAPAPPPAPAGSVPPPTPAASCDAGSLPENTQGRAPLADVASGRYAQGYSCNAVQVAKTGTTGGYRVERYVDTAGNECAYADTTLLFPQNVPDQGTTGAGTYVYDMKDPAKPVLTATLKTVAMASPHESLRLNAKRGLLVAVFASPTAEPGIVDVYDVSADCRTPRLISTTPLGVLGHEGGFAPDGLTYYVGSLFLRTVTAIDLADPALPKLAWVSTEYGSHGLSVSNDGNTLFIGEAAIGDGFSGMTVLDVRQVQQRVPNPTVPVISRLTWPSVSTPQSAVPFTSKGKKYVMEIDEFGSGAAIGAGRIIDINDITQPFVVSELRLAVNQAAAQGPDLDADPGNSNAFQGYQGHYCSLPSRVDPQILACSFIMSGLRVFDIGNVAKPKEIAYFNQPVVLGSVATSPTRAGSFAMSAPAYDGATGDIWYTDGNSGFYVVRLTGSAKGTFAKTVVNPGS